MICSNGCDNKLVPDLLGGRPVCGYCGFWLAPVTVVAGETGWADYSFEFKTGWYDRLLPTQPAKGSE